MKILKPDGLYAYKGIANSTKSFYAGLLESYCQEVVLICASRFINTIYSRHLKGDRGRWLKVRKLSYYSLP